MWCMCVFLATGAPQRHIYEKEHTLRSSKLSSQIFKSITNIYADI